MNVFDMTESRKMAKLSILVLLLIVLECRCMVCPNTDSGQPATSNTFNLALKEMKQQIKSYKKVLRPHEMHKKGIKVQQDDFKDIACSFSSLTENIQWALSAMDKISQDDPNLTSTKPLTSVLKQLSNSSCNALQIYRNLTGTNMCKITANSTETSDFGKLVTKEFNTLCKVEYFVSCLLKSNKSGDFIKSKKLVCKRKSRKCRIGKKGGKSIKKKGKKNNRNRKRPGKNSRKDRKKPKRKGKGRRNKNKTKKCSKKNDSKRCRKNNKRTKKTGRSNGKDGKKKNRKDGDGEKNARSEDRGSGEIKKNAKQGDEEFPKHQTDKYNQPKNTDNEPTEVNILDICRM